MGMVFAFGLEFGSCKESCRAFAEYAAPPDRVKREPRYRLAIAENYR
jgi:hypothetical protein